MDFSIVVMTLGAWGAVLLGVKMVLNYRAQVKTAPRDMHELLESMAASLEDLRAEVTEMNDHSHDMSERMDEISGRVEFAERLLARGDSEVTP